MPQRRAAQIFFYFLVGGSTALVYIFVCVLLTRLGMPAGLASVAGYLLVIPPAYFGQKILTFRSSAWHRIAVPKYLALQLVGSIAGYFLSNRLARAGLPDWAVFGAVAIMVAVTNFLALKYWTFRAQEPNAQLNLAAPGSWSVRIAARARKRMFASFMRTFGPRENDTVLDIGVTSDQSYESSNYFEALYPWKHRITAAGLDDASFLEDRYPGVRFVPADVIALPFANSSFDLVHSSAVIEHVGSRTRQQQMLGECLRVSRRGVCLTTPNRWFPVEFHTQLPLLHWLPPRLHRPLFNLLGYGFFARESNLNLLSRRSLLSLADAFPAWRFEIRRQRLLGMTSNLLLFAWRV
jgi:putative flippase GtrA